MKKQKKGQLKYYQMVLYTIKNYIKKYIKNIPSQW